jgi:hypothetical protein
MTGASPVFRANDRLIGQPPDPSTTNNWIRPVTHINVLIAVLLHPLTARASTRSRCKPHCAPSAALACSSLHQYADCTLLITVWCILSQPGHPPDVHFAQILMVTGLLYQPRCLALQHTADTQPISTHARGAFIVLTVDLKPYKPS